MDPDVPTDVIVEGLSAEIAARYGTVTANVASHCILTLGAPGPIKANNVEIISAFEAEACSGTMFAMGELNNYFYMADTVNI